MKSNFFIPASLFLLAELYLFTGTLSWLFFGSSFLILLFFSWYFAKKISLSILALFVPVLEYYLFNILDSQSVKHSLAFLSFLGVYVLFNGRIKKQLIILTSLSEFLFVSLILYANFLLYEKSFLSLAFPIFISSFLIFFSSIAGVLNMHIKLKIRLFYFSLVLGIIMTEAFLMISKLPFNVVSAAFLFFVFYYIFWDITTRYFAGTLTKKSLFSIFAFFLLILALIFTTVRFLIG